MHMHTCAHIGRGVRMQRIQLYVYSSHHTRNSTYSFANESLWMLKHLVLCQQLQLRPMLQGGVFTIPTYSNWQLIVENVFAFLFVCFFLKKKSKQILTSSQRQKEKMLDVDKTAQWVESINIFWICVVLCVSGQIRQCSHNKSNPPHLLVLVPGVWEWVGNPWRHHT